MTRNLASSFGVVALFAMSLTGGEVIPPKQAPELVIKFPGQPDRALSQYRGKVVVIEFVSTICPHCQKASQLMTKIQSDLGSRGFQAIDVAVNQNADLLVENFAKDFNVGFPVGWTTYEQALKFLGFPATTRFLVPQFILIDRGGMIHYQSAPEADAALAEESFVRSQIERLLAAPAPHSAPGHKSGKN